MASHTRVPDTYRKILGVRFYAGELQGLLDTVDSAGLMAFPSAPVMVGLEEDGDHREAVEGADVAVTDSSLMVLVWLLRTGERLPRISGLRFLRALLQSGRYRSRSDTFWVMPSPEDAAANLAYLRGCGFDVGSDDACVAPLYPRQGPLKDDALVARIEALRPKLVFLCLSGGVQERLGWHLRRTLSYRPTILCIGGAIAFLSGRQIRIPVVADRLGLGWLLRFVAAPAAFSAKVRGVWRLVPMVWRYRSESVPPRLTR